MFSEGSTGFWVVLQLPCCQSNQGKHTEHILQNLFYKLPPQTVPQTIDMVGYPDFKNILFQYDSVYCRASWGKGMMLPFFRFAVVVRFSLKIGPSKSRRRPLYCSQTPPRMDRLPSENVLGGFHIWRPQKCRDFLPPPPGTYRNQLILFILSAFWGPPSPPSSADVIYGNPLRRVTDYFSLIPLASPLLLHGQHFGHSLGASQRVWSR